MTAIEELVRRRTNNSPGERLPESDRPTTFEQAFALQLNVAKGYSLVDPIDFAGWKCGTPNNGNNIVAPLFDNERQFASLDEPHRCLIHPNDDDYAVIEPELAFELIADLPPKSGPYTETEVDLAIGKTHIAFELIQSRYREPSEVPFLEMLADGLVNQGVWLGPEIHKTDDTTLANIQIRFQEEGEAVEEFSGVHPNGRARAGLYWLANFLSEQGIGLQRGQHIITGSYAGVIKLKMATVYRVSYEGLGEFSIQFTNK